MYMLAAVFVSGLLPVAGWRSTRNRAGAVTFHGQYDAAPSISTQYPASIVSSVSIALRQLAPLMAEQDVRVDVALGHDLVVQMPGVLLTELLDSLLTEAINHARGGHLLITAIRERMLVTISATDDRPGADLAARRDGLADLAEQVCRLGGGLAVEQHPGEGTTVSLQLVGTFDRCASR